MASRSADMVATKDDRLTLMAVSALACILQDVLHEGMGHGLTAWLSGACGWRGFVLCIPVSHSFSCLAAESRGRDDLGVLPSGANLCAQKQVSRAGNIPMLADLVIARVPGERDHLL